MDIRKVKKLIELLETSGISEIEITEGEERVRISRLTTQPVLVPTAAATAVTQAPLPPVISSESSTPLPPLPGHTIQAPMVGVFYRSAAPDKPPFVEVGQTIKAGDSS